MRAYCGSTLLLGISIASAAGAEFSIVQTARELAHVDVSQGQDPECGANRVVWSGPMWKGDRLTLADLFDGGRNGDRICWRRQEHPRPPGPWTRCTADGTCEIR